MNSARPVGPQAVDRTSALPLWAQVHADLQHRLERGEFNAAFPGELALVGEYDVSRHTVREALRRMRDQGVVTAERGRPPRVTAPTEFAQPVGTLYSLFAAVTESGQRQDSTVRVLDTRADGVVASRLGLEEATPLVFLERLRRADGEPLALDRVWLPAQVAAPLLDADFSNTALYTELARRCDVRVSGGSEHIRAVVPSRAERALLHMPDDVAALAIDRLGHSNGTPTEWRHTLVRGDRFAVTADFSRTSGIQLGSRAFGSSVPVARRRRAAVRHAGR